MPSTFLLHCFCFLIVAVHCMASSRKLVLVPTPSPALPYHQGPLLTGPSPINLYYIWYGTFSSAQKSILADFAASFSSPSLPAPFVVSWWATAASYTDASKHPVSSSVKLVSEISLPSSSLSLKKSDVQALLVSALSSKMLQIDSNGMYFVFTSDNVAVEDFCMNSCGYHDSVVVNGVKVPYGWVGNPAKQCPGFCAWPFAKPAFGPMTAPLVAPNGDVGMDGMVINLATVLAGAVTNPFDSGYYQGDAAAPLEAASACAGIFGKDAYPGNPGTLFTDSDTKASYNAHGSNGRLFLLPALWSPSSQTCTPIS